MKFIPSHLQGLRLIELEPRDDARGSFARTYCEREFEAQGLNTRWAQCNSTLTRRRGSIRGLHYQAEPRSESKLIRCVAGRVFDVVVDIRKDSPTYGQHAAFELSSAGARQLYVPAGFAHGFQCLEDNCELFYQMSEFYHPDLARGVRWNDPALRIQWPLEVTDLSDRDRDLPLLGA
ncbi:MAG: dTDP-4-dehydrorhamnose 3,5-epimerase [Verrucomicrobia bacterium]|nr:dTDP-4-dehydrorhamnose 3,5-epimerase [Verrucomicrobiota bacterium]